MSNCIQLVPFLFFLSPLPLRHSVAVLASTCRGHLTSHPHLPVFAHLRSEAAPPSRAQVSPPLLRLHHFSSDRTRRCSEVRHTWATFCCGCFLHKPLRICPCAKRWGDRFVSHLYIRIKLVQSSCLLCDNLKCKLSFLRWIAYGFTVGGDLKLKSSRNRTFVALWMQTFWPKAS